MKKIFFAFAFFLTISAAIQCQSLYGSGISPESALVRVVFTEINSEMNIEIGNARFSSSEGDESAQYHQVSPGMFFFEAGTQWVEFMAQSGKYFTVIINNEQCFIYEDIEHKSPAKTQLYFYNLAQEKATLHITDKGDAVFEKITPGDSIQRAINPLSIDFTITLESEKSIDLGELPMTRGGSTSVILYNDEDTLKTEILEAVIAMDL